MVCGAVGAIDVCLLQVPKAKELFDTASGILGYDLLEKCKTGPKNVLDSTVRVSRKGDTRTCFSALQLAFPLVN